jgi:hypothetical protein
MLVLLAAYLLALSLLAISLLAASSLIGRDSLASHSSLRTTRLINPLPPGRLTQSETTH